MLLKNKPASSENNHGKTIFNILTTIKKQGMTTYTDLTQ